VTVRYSLRRGDVWNAYWFTWRSGWTLKISQLVIASCAFFVALSWLAPRGSASYGAIATSVAIALLSILWLPLYPLLRFKPQVRTLSIGPPGIVTSIGTLSKEVPWSAVGRLESSDERFYIIARSGNALVIPAQAFVSRGDREEFERSAREWWLARRAP
jgi:hypothetical protein